MFNKQNHSVSIRPKITPKPTTTDTDTNTSPRLTLHLPPSRLDLGETPDHPPRSTEEPPPPPPPDPPTPTAPDDPAKNRPLSRLSLSSTPNIFKRIRAGMSMRGASSSSLVSHLERIGPAPTSTSRSTSSLYSNLTEPKSPNQLIYNLPDPTSPENSQPFELRNDPSNAQADCSSQHHSTMEQVRTKQSIENHPPDTAGSAILRSYSDASIGGLGIYNHSNRSIQTTTRPNSSCHYRREPPTDYSTPHKLHLRPLSPNKLRRPKTSIATIPRPTPTPTTTHINVDPTPSKSSKSRVLERINDEETEEEYLVRLGEKVQRSKIPSVLASSNLAFHLSALKKFMETFEFSHDPIDLSIRKLLMTVDLPPETQQIDRVIECFAKRYTECNPKLFKDPDQVYILAFSIIMLHTDAFNKSNKAKMTRADYVKNTKLDGITTELLEYIYDNVTYTPFIYVESNGQDPPRPNYHQHSNDITGLFSLTSNNAAIPLSPRMSPGPNNFKVRLDPYQWISQGWTDELRPDLGSVIPSRNPFSFTGSVSWFDFKRLKESFSSKKSVMIQIVNQSPFKPNSIFKQIESEDFLLESCNLQQQHFISSTSNFRKQRDDDPTTATMNDSTDNQLHRPCSRLHHAPASSPDLFLNLRAIKVGLIHLKIDLPFLISSSQSQSPSHPQSQLINESNLNRNVITKKWKLFCVLLSAGQLIFIKDFGLIGELQESIKLAGIKNQSNPDDQLVVRITGLKPDAVLSLDGAIALMDSTYKRRPCTFRLILSKNLSVLMALNDNDEMDSWITHINYAAAHKTHRIPFRSFDNHVPSSCPVSILHSANENNTAPIQRGQTDSKRSFESLLAMPKRQSRDQPSLSRSASISNMLSRSQDRRRTSTPAPSTSPAINHTSKSPRRLSNVSYGSSIPTQYDIVRATILNIEAQIHASKKELNEDLRLARNLAVLTPFQLSTRSRLHQAIIPIADRVRSSRCLLSKLVCYREILIRGFPTTRTGSSSSVNNAPSTTKLDSSVKGRPASPTRNSPEKEKKESPVTTTSSQWSDNNTNNNNNNNKALASERISLPRQPQVKRRQNSVGDVFALDPSSSLSQQEKNEIKNSRRASLGDRFQRTSIDNNNNHRFETLPLPHHLKAASKKSSDSNSHRQSLDHHQKQQQQQQQQQQKRLSGSFIMCGISAVKSTHSPMPTAVRKSCDLNENRIPYHHADDDAQQINHPSSQIASTSADGVSSSSTTTPVTNNTISTDATNSAASNNSNKSGTHQQSIERDAQNLDDEDEDEEVIRTTSLRKVGRHQSQDYFEDHERPPNFLHRVSDPSSSFTRARSSTSTTNHSSSSRNFSNNSKTTQSLSRSFSKFPKGLLLSSSSSSSKRNLNQTSPENKHNKLSQGHKSILVTPEYLRSKQDKLHMVQKDNNRDEVKERGKSLEEAEKVVEEEGKRRQTMLMIKLDERTGDEVSTTATTTTGSTPTPSSNRTRMMMKAKLAWNRSSNEPPEPPTTTTSRGGGGGNIVVGRSTETTSSTSSLKVDANTNRSVTMPATSRTRLLSNHNPRDPEKSAPILAPLSSTANTLHGSTSDTSSTTTTTTTTNTHLVSLDHHHHHRLTIPPNSNRFTNAWGLP